MSTSPVMQPEPPRSRPSHPVWYLGIALALAGNIALLIHSHTLARNLADTQAATQAQIASLNDQLARTTAASEKRVDTVAREARESAASAQERALSEARRNQAALSAKLTETREAEQQARRQMGGDIDELRQQHSATDTKVTELGGDVNGVKGEVASAKSDIESHGNELKRVNGDMGVMSGLIATNAKELASLRELGERNYVEFDLKKKSEPQNVGGIQLSLAKADARRNRYTMNVVAGDKRFEKRDRTINEPVQLYVAGNRQPVEIVVNEVKKDEVVGYVSVPKVSAPRR